MLLNISYSWHSCKFHGKHLFKALHTFYWGDICLFCFWWVKEHCLFYRLDYNWPCRICPWELFVLTRFAFLYTWCTKGFILATVNSHTSSSTACTSDVTSKNPLPSSERLRTDFLPSFMSQLWNIDHWAHFCQWYSTGFNFTPLGAVSHFRGGGYYLSKTLFHWMILESYCKSRDPISGFFFLMSGLSGAFIILSIHNLGICHCTRTIPLEALYIHSKFWWQSLWEARRCSTEIPQETGACSFLWKSVLSESP